MGVALGTEFHEFQTFGARTFLFRDIIPGETDAAGENDLLFLFHEPLLSRYLKSYLLITF